MTDLAGANVGPQVQDRLQHLDKKQVTSTPIGRGFALAQVCAGDGAAGEYAMDAQ
jgi:hypothetical protein